MNYADNHCTYTEEFEPEHVYKFTGKCVVTGKEVTVSVKAKELYTYRQGELSQVSLKSNTADEREFLISGTSAEGWKKLFGDSE